MTMETALYHSLENDKHILPKAVANYIFREIVEDAHSKYGISEEDMRRMCIEAVDRAETLLSVLPDPELKKALVLYGYPTREWDDPDGENVAVKLKQFREMAANIS